MSEIMNMVELKRKFGLAQEHIQELKQNLATATEALGKKELALMELVHDVFFNEENIKYAISDTLWHSGITTSFDNVSGAIDIDYNGDFDKYKLELEERIKQALEKIKGGEK